MAQRRAISMARRTSCSGICARRRSAWRCTSATSRGGRCRRSRRAWTSWRRWGQRQGVRGAAHAEHTPLPLACPVSCPALPCPVLLRYLWNLLSLVCWPHQVLAFIRELFADQKHWHRCRWPLCLAAPSLYQPGAYVGSSTLDCTAAAGLYWCDVQPFNRTTALKNTGAVPASREGMSGYSIEHTILGAFMIITLSYTGRYGRL